jgi:phosphoserine phosphatase
LQFFVTFLSFIKISVSKCVYSWKIQSVDEIIVVDDKSIDDTVQVANQYGIELSNTIAVGDSEYDICMVRFAGIGVSFCSNNIVLNNIADQKIETKSFKPILDFAI